MNNKVLFHFRFDWIASGFCELLSFSPAHHHLVEGSTLTIEIFLRPPPTIIPSFGARKDSRASPYFCFYCGRMRIHKGSRSVIHPLYDSFFRMFMTWQSFLIVNEPRKREEIIKNKVEGGWKYDIKTKRKVNSSISARSQQQTEVSSWWAQNFEYSSPSFEKAETDDSVYWQLWRDAE